MILFTNIYHVSLLYVILFIFNITAEKNVPVLIWESSSKNSSIVLPLALAKLTTSNFLGIFAEKLNLYHQPPLVLVFAEEKLSVEDFSWKDNSGQGSFPQLGALTARSASTTFFPSVTKAIKGLKHALSQRGYIVKTLDFNSLSCGNLDHNCDMESIKTIGLANRDENFDESEESPSTLDQDGYNFLDRSADVNMEQTKSKGSVMESNVTSIKTKKSDDGISMPKAYVLRLSAAKTGESRPSLLRKHDREITQAFTTHLSVQSNIIGVYTALTAASCFTENKLRHRRQDPEPDPAPEPVPNPVLDPDLELGIPLIDPSLRVWGDAGSTVLIYFHKSFPGIELLKAKIKSEVIAKSMTSIEDSQYLRLIITGTVADIPINLGLCFSLTISYWELVKVETTDSNGSVKDLLPRKKIIVARNSSYTCKSEVVFTDGVMRLVMADFQMQAYMSLPRFSAAQDCVSYFSIGIWSGIIVSFLLIVVLAWAITMIMNIKGNDKMDDRYGKTLNLGSEK